MDQELKQKWIAALRSGEWRQCGGRLYRSEMSPDSLGRTGHCCLGVLAVLAGLPLGDGTQANDPHGTVAAIYGDRPDEVAPIIPIGISNTCMRMNDNSGASFAEIADYIEANL